MEHTGLADATLGIFYEMVSKAGVDVTVQVYSVQQSATDFSHSSLIILAERQLRLYCTKYIERSYDMNLSSPLARSSGLQTVYVLTFCVHPNLFISYLFLYACTLTQCHSYKRLNLLA